MNRMKISLIVLVAVAIGAFFYFDLGHYLRLDYIQSQQARLETFHGEHPWLSAGIYVGIYILVTALSLPGAAIMTLAGGALFGLALGTVLTSFASVIGATLAFLVARFVLRESVQRRFAKRLQAINAGIERDGAFYLFTLRLVPAFPFFVVNLVMGLTRIRTGTFFWVSQLGMLPGTLVYVNAGTQLSQIQSLGGILSPGLLLSFVLLGVFPLLAKKALALFKSQRSTSAPHGESQ